MERENPTHLATQHASDKVYSHDFLASFEGEAAVRLFFHLKDAHEVIPDHVGVEVPDLQDATAEVLRAVREVRNGAQDLSGWTLVAVDGTGTVFTLDLDRIV